MARRSQSTRRPSPSAPKRESFWSIPPWFPTDPSLWLRVLVIAAATLWVYWPALRGGPLLDDDWYYTNNPLLKSFAGLGKFWFSPGAWVEYYPIHETVMWLQWQNWGANTLGYHLTNVVLQIINALLFWRLLARLGVRWAWVGGLLLAIHPVEVDSIANMTELKNALSLAPFLLALIAWIDFDRSGRRNDYRAALGWFLVAMLCKISVAPFPFVLLLYAWWKRGRIGLADLKAAVPFFAVAIVFSAVTIWAGHAYATAGHAQEPPFSLGDPLTRIARAGMILAYYVTASFAPVGLAPAYPQWPTDPANVFIYFPWLVVVAVIAWAWVNRHGAGRHVLLGLGFFGLTVAPYLGFVAISYMHDSWVELHLLYLPLVGLIGLVTAGLSDLNAKLPAVIRPGLIGLIAVLVLLLAFQARAYAGWFVDEETLWTRTLKLYPQSWLARYNYGVTLSSKHQDQDALPLLEQAAAEKPDYADGHDSLASTLARLGRKDEAVAQYQRALQLNPDDTKALLGLGEIAQRDGRLDEAKALLQRGLDLAPDDASLASDMAGLLLQQGQVADALRLYQQAVAQNPDVAQLQYNLGMALLQTGDLSGAADHLQAAVALDSEIASAHENLGVVLARLGHLPEAAEQFAEVVRLDSTSAKARDNLGLALVNSGHVREGTEQFQKALEIDPNDTRARDSLRQLQAAPLNGTTGN